MRATYLQRPRLRDQSDDQIIAAWVGLQGARAAEASAVNGGGDPTPLQNQRVVVRIKRAGQVFREFRSSWQRHQKLESARKPTIMIHGALRSIKLLYGAKKRLRSKQPLMMKNISKRCSRTARRDPRVVQKFLNLPTTSHCRNWLQ